MHIDDSEPDLLPLPCVRHVLLETTFHGITHPLSTPDAPLHQYRGIKYASIPARFRQSKLVASYPPDTDATKYGPICPQVKSTKSMEELQYHLDDADVPKQTFKQNEFECLSLNITCPVVSTDDLLPVMVWVHGGGDQGSGSNWLYDGGSLVRRSVTLGTPIIMVSFNYRLGLFGFAANPMISNDNKTAGDDGVGNYGLRDQRRALEWIHHFISDFGGDPNNVTVFGASSGAADIVSHLLSTSNMTRPLFHRAIIQSPILDPDIPDVAAAGWQLSRVMSALQVTSVEQLRTIDADKLVPFGQTLRVVDDGNFLRPGWRKAFALPTSQTAHTERKSTSHHHRSISRSKPARSLSRPRSANRFILQLPPNLQPLIIGDAAADSLLWSLPASHWSSAGITRRLKAICQSLTKASQILNAYDISHNSENHELVERILDLINDARVAWPLDLAAQTMRDERGGHGVWRYVFDQEGPTRGLQHHAADLIYLFDNTPLPLCTRPSATPPSTPQDFGDSFYSFCDDDDDGMIVLANDTGSDTDWIVTVDQFTYARVRDTMQEKWISFANGDAPWNEDKIFVFGPEGETGERSNRIFEGRRRKHTWKEILEPLGMQLVHKIGVELSRGPPLR